MRQIHLTHLRSLAGWWCLAAALCLLFSQAAHAQRGQRGGNEVANPQTLRDLNETPFPGVEIPDAIDRATVARAMAGGLPVESRGNWGMSPHATVEIVRAALERSHVPLVAGPAQETWQSVADNHQFPDWMIEGKVGIFIHFGLYSVPAHGSEWYQKHMYGNAGIRNWHIENFGPLDKFGYKDFIPKFTVPNFKPEEWAAAFKESGAKWVMFSGEHHDGFSLWDSKTNPYNSVKLGPRRDITRELGAAVRAAGLKYGITNHTIEHYDFIEPQNIPQGMATDLRQEGWEDFYWTTHSDERMVQHLANWVDKNIELIDQYQPDVVWYDNGLNHRIFDPLKLKVLAYYLNRAQAWGKQVSLAGKGTCFPAGGVQDFEGMSRVARAQTPFPWMVHDKIAGSWGYVEGRVAGNPETMTTWITEVISRNGVIALNVGPKGDGSIPQDQIDCLKAIGRWMATNGEAVYGTHIWKKEGEGKLTLGRGERYTAQDLKFTQKNGNLYAFFMAWPADGKVLVTSLPKSDLTGAATSVFLLGHEGRLPITQDGAGLSVQLPTARPELGPFALKITGLKLD